MLGASRGPKTREYQVLSTTNITSTGSQHYVVPAGTLYIEIEMWGGGGGGGHAGSQGGRGGTTYYNGGGGGAGGYVKLTYRPSNMHSGDKLNFTVGSGGAGDSNANFGGTSGSATTISNHTREIEEEVSSLHTFSSVSAGGGNGGESVPGGFVGGSGFSNGGVSTGGDTNTNGGAGESRLSSGSSGIAGGDGGDAPNGGAGGDGGDAAGIPASSSADNGVAPGGGGGGGGSAQTNGGNGADGKVIVKAYG